MATNVQEKSTSGLLLHQARRYDFMVWLLTAGRERRFRERMLRPACIQPGEAVLDAGCGTGSLALVARRQAGAAGRVCGLDASPEMIARAQCKAARAGLDVAFFHAPVEAMPFADAEFDVVLSTLMLHHLPPALRTRCATEIRRVLKPGGRVLAVDFAASPARRHFGPPRHRHGHVSPAEIAGHFRAAGLEISESGPLGISTLHFVLAAAPGHTAPPDSPETA